MASIRVKYSFKVTGRPALRNSVKRFKKISSLLIRRDHTVGDELVKVSIVPVESKYTTTIQQGFSRSLPNGEVGKAKIFQPDLETIAISWRVID